jgi:hypothetical protein
MSGASRSTARLSAGARVTWAVVVVYINIVVQLDSSRAVQLNLLESLSHNIVGLALRVLSGLDDSGLVYVALVVNIHVLEGIGELEDLILIELRVFSSDSRLCTSWSIPLQLDHVHDCGGGGEGGAAGRRGRWRAEIALVVLIMRRPGSGCLIVP